MSVDDTVTFSDLSRNPRAVAERAAAHGRLRVTHRDARDFYLIAADREELRDETLRVTAQVLLALARLEQGAGSLRTVMPHVFPWVRHLSDLEVGEFATELVSALSDAAELDADANVHTVIAGWLATARIKANPAVYREAVEATSGDFGHVEAPE
jgi:hypothetical protein